MFDLLAQCFATDQIPDALAISSMRREAAQVLKTADRAPGHILCSGVAALEWNVEEARQQVELAVQLDASPTTLMNAIVTLEFLNRPELAEPYARAAAELVPWDKTVADGVSGLLIAIGRVADAAAVQEKCLASDPEADFSLDAAELLRGLRAAEVSEEWLAEELAIARQVLIEAKVRTRQFAYDCEGDPDGGSSVSLGLTFFGGLKDEFELDDQLALRLAATDRWNPSRLSVQLHADADASNPG